MLIDSLDIKVLRYIVAVDQAKSISRAAKSLYVSHSSISRAIAKTENELGMQLFYRTPLGVEATENGLEFIKQARSVLNEIDSLQRNYYSKKIQVRESLLVAANYSTSAENCFIDFYKRYGQYAEKQNFVFLEGTLQEVLNYISTEVCDIGEICCTSDHSESLFKRLTSSGLIWERLEQSPVSVQVRAGHPLTKYSTVAIEDLSPYPHIVFSDEAITNINYCSDVTKFNEYVYNKRIVVCERGTLRNIVYNTDGYYIGTYYGNQSFSNETDAVYIPLKDVDFTLDTYLIMRKKHVLSDLEKKYISLLRNMYNTDGEHPILEKL